MTLGNRARNRASAQLRGEGRTYAEIAREFGITRQRAWRIAKTEKIRAHGVAKDPETFYRTERFG